MTDLRERLHKIKTGTERVVGAAKSVAKKSQTAWNVAKAGVKTAVAGVALGTGIHVYHQFHKTPEEAHKDTIVMEEKVKKEVKEIADKAMGTNDTSVVKKGIKEGASKIAGMGASHGGALREWIIRKTQTK